MVRGTRAASTGQLDEALEAFNSVAAALPQYARVHALIANVNVLKKDYARAIAEYNRAVELNPGAAGLYHDRGITFATRGEYDQALADLSRALEIDPLYKMAYFYRGNAYADTQRVDEAIADYRKVIEIDPQFINAYLNRGSLLFSEKEKPQEALADFSAVISIDSKNSDAFYNRGVVYASLSDFEKAIGDFTIAYLLDPRNSDAYFAKARVFEQQGKVVQAAQLYKEFIQTAAPEQKEYVRAAYERLNALAGATDK
jgi:tetratricopeptide (TPR) repeat protein